MNIYVYVWVIFKYENSSEKNRVIINRPLWGKECQMKKSKNWKSSLRKLPGIFFLDNNGSKGKEILCFLDAEV